MVQRWKKRNDPNMTEKIVDFDVKHQNKEKHDNTSLSLFTEMLETQEGGLFFIPPGMKYVGGI